MVRTWFSCLLWSVTVGLQATGSNENILIRQAKESDYVAITDIYAYYVCESISTFELVPPSVEEISRRMESGKAQGLPCFVCETTAGAIVGYAYVRPHNTRAAYDCTVDLGIYLRHGEGETAWTGKGLGRRLLGELFTFLRAVQLPRSHESGRSGQRFLQVMALRSRFHEPDGEYESAPRGFYTSVGFRYVGTCTKVGYKFGRWADVDYYQIGLDEVRD